MQPNITVYGSPSEWYNQHFTQNIPPKYRNKKPYFGGTDARLETAIANNKITGGQPIDSSISYCGLGSESDLSHANTICRINGDIVVKTVDREITNFMIWEKSGYNIFSRMNGALYNNNQYGWTDDLSSDNINRYIEPLCSIKPTNQVLEIRVFAYSPTLDRTIDVDLDTYCSASYTDYPQIQTVYVECQWGSSPERGANIPNYEFMQVKFCIGLLDPYKYIDDTEVYNFALSAQDRSNIGILSGMSNVVYDINAVSDNLPVFYGDTNMYTVAPTLDNMIRVYRDITNDNIDDVKEYYLRQAACFGLYFSPKHNVAINGVLTDTDMYIGILDSNGVGHGDYLRGADTVNAPQNNLTDMYDIGYNPDNGDNTNYTDGNIFKTFDFSLNSTNKFYVLSEMQLSTLASELFTIMRDAPVDQPIEKYNTSVFLTQNPIDCIISIKRFPVPVPHFADTTSLKIGSKNTNIDAYELNKSCGVYYFDFKNSDGTGLFPTFGKSFLDYEPYTKININVPFCGTFDVPCNYFHKYGGVTIALIIDFITGAATALLLVNDDVVDSLTGTASIDIPISGIQSATIDSQIFNASLSKQKQDSNYTLSMLGGAAAITLGVATGGTAAVIGGVAALAGSAINKDINDRSLNYELTHMQAPVKQVSSASSPIAQFCDTRCKMIISRPEYVDNYNAEVYANTIGFACLRNGKVKDFTGLTQGDIRVDNVVNVNGMSPTDTEKQMIYNAFANGVIL